MLKKRLLSFILLAALLVGLTAIAPVRAQVVQAQAATVVYNLYATDGYVELADGTTVFTYGFIGGRQNAASFTYQTSVCTGDGVGRTCATPTNVTVAGGAPAPTGGPIQLAEAALAGNAQFPAPVIYASVGDVVEIRLKNLGIAANPNAPNDPHSIHLHGMDVDAANDGVPETSVGAVPANLCADGSTATPGSTCAQPAPGAGNVIVYMFTPKAAGTYMYHCHQEADIHVNMGMYGALVVYNPLDAAAAVGPGQGLGGTFGGFPYDKDYIMLVSEMDTRGHADEEGTYVPGGLAEPESWDPDPYNWAQYKPQYWFINGLSFPQTIHAGFPSGYTYADWILAHPGYETLYTGSVSTPPGLIGDWTTPGDKVLLRVINMGFETQPLHMHGYHGKILGSDQRVWDWSNKPGNLAVKNPKPPTAFGLGLEKNTLTVGSGETYEWLVDFGQQAFQSTYPAGTYTRINNTADPVTGLLLDVPCDPLQLLNATMPNTATTCALTPEGYIGGPTVTGIDSQTQPFDLAGFSTSQYFPFHNHDDYKATNNGSYPGGMFTMLVPLP